MNVRTCDIEQYIQYNSGNDVDTEIQRLQHCLEFSEMNSFLLIITIIFVTEWVYDIALILGNWYIVLYFIFILQLFLENIFYKIKVLAF